MDTAGRDTARQLQSPHPSHGSPLAVSLMVLDGRQDGTVGILAPGHPFPVNSIICTNELGKETVGIDWSTLWEDSICAMLVGSKKIREQS